MERRALTLRGIVQGVGFRPFVCRLARQWNLSGNVRNEAGSLRIEIEGVRASLDLFFAELVTRPPPLADIQEIASTPINPLGDSGFRILTSAVSRAPDVFISPDVATCADCLRELFEPTDRRYRYPFLNCTNCGPRLTIVAGAPYDRGRTTMAGFAMCRECRDEYENPNDRRYHAQPTCCPRCGPQLELLTSRHSPIASADPLVAFATSLRDGRIGALKGLGGYHLVCDATCQSTVAELRRRKSRDDKPLALMVASLEHAEKLGEINAAERELLVSAARPIVLLRRKHTAESERFVARGVAPGNPALGLMLPYTPLHHLLLDAMGGVPLVMTSGNRSDEPIAYEDGAAFEQLGGHRRPIPASQSSDSHSMRRFRDAGDR